MDGFLRDNWKVIIGTAVVTLVVSFGTFGAERLFSSNKFCTSCHSMSYPNEELKESTHYGALGINPRCEDCHLPANFLLRVESHIIDGTRGLIGEFRHNLKTKEGFDEHRAEYAHNARVNLRKWDSSPCRDCHKNVKPSSEDAERKHRKMETEGATCIDCHQNLVHDEVPEEDIVKGMAEGRIVLKKKAKKGEADGERGEKAGKTGPVTEN